MSEAEMIPYGYRIVYEGQVLAGDKYWDSKLLAWLPITVNDGRMVVEFSAVIRKS